MCSKQPCSIVLVKLQGLPMLRSLELVGASLEEAAQPLQQLTQITQLVLKGCNSPATLADLPEQLVRLSIDNIAKQDQQLSQQGSSTTLPHLISLTLSGNSVTDATMREVSSFPQLKDITLLWTDRVTLSGGLVCLQQLHTLTSLRVSRLMPGSSGSVGYSSLSGISSLRCFALTYPEPAVTVLGLAQALVHVPSIQLHIGDWVRNEKVAGNSVEVRLGMKVTCLYVIRHAVLYTSHWKVNNGCILGR